VQSPDLLLSGYGTKATDERFISSMRTEKELNLSSEM